MWLCSLIFLALLLYEVTMLMVFLLSWNVRIISYLILIFSSKIEGHKLCMTIFKWVDFWGDTEIRIKREKEGLTGVIEARFQKSRNIVTNLLWTFKYAYTSLCLTKWLFFPLILQLQYQKSEFSLCVMLPFLPPYFLLRI
jgi:hypothetical protein